MASKNSLQLAGEVVNTLRLAGLDVWLFGGWAEELRGVRRPGPHSDIDLLLRGKTFSELEGFLSNRPGTPEILAKRFSHKRAFTWDGVLVEVILVGSISLQTIFFDGRAVIDWPADTFTQLSPEGLPIASTEALALYRREHQQIVNARRRRRPSF